MGTLACIYTAECIEFVLLVLAEWYGNMINKFKGERPLNCVLLSCRLSIRDLSGISSLLLLLFNVNCPFIVKDHCPPWKVAQTLDETSLYTDLTATNLNAILFQ